MSLVAYETEKEKYKAGQHTEFNPCPDIFGHLIAEIE